MKAARKHEVHFPFWSSELLENDVMLSFHFGFFIQGPEEAPGARNIVFVVFLRLLKPSLGNKKRERKTLFFCFQFVFICLFNSSILGLFMAVEDLIFTEYSD